MNFLGQGMTAMMTLPASTIAAPIVADIAQPIAQYGSEKIVQPVVSYLAKHPVLNGIAQTGRYLLDASGTGYGLYHLFGDEGLKKTAKKFNEGNLFGAMWSGLGDATDAVGFGGLIDLGVRGYKGTRSVYNNVRNAYRNWRTNRNLDRAIANLQSTRLQMPETDYETFRLEDLPPAPPQYNNPPSDWTPLQRRAKRAISWHPDVRQLSDDELSLILMEFDHTDSTMWDRRVEVLDRLRGEHPILQVPGDEYLLSWFDNDDYNNAFINRLNQLELSPEDNVIRDGIINEVRRTRNVSPDSRRVARSLIDKLGEGVPQEFLTSTADIVGRKVYNMYNDMPRGSGLLERNTSIDSEALKTFYASRYGGIGPGKARIHVTSWDGLRNGAQKIRFGVYDMPEHLQKYYDTPWNDIPVDVQNEITTWSQSRAQNALSKLRRGWQGMINNDLVTLPSGRNLDNLIGFSYRPKDDVYSHITPQFYSPDFQIFKQRLGGKIKK